MHLSASGFSQVPVKIAEKYPTSRAIITAESIQKAESDGITDRQPVLQSTARYQQNDFTVKINGAAVMKNICVDICIATYKRPALLRKLLLSIVNQKLPASIAIRVIVIDNDPERSAEKEVYSLLQTARIDFIYDMQPEQNISLTRNLAIDYATAEYAVFVDDDETVSKVWLLKLVQTAAEYAADVVFGPVIPVYPKNTPEWVLKGKFFNRKRCKTGADIFVGATGNTLVRRKKVFDDLRLRFDASYGLTGGGDTHLFKRARDGGAKLIWCDEAEVYEVVIENRLNVEWLAKRAFRGGQVYSRIFYGKLPVGKKILRILQRVLYLGIALFILLLSLPLPKHITVHALRKVMANAGQLSAFFSKNYYEEYAN